MLLKSLKTGMKLPLLNNYVRTDHYLEQLKAEHYLNGLLEGYMLNFRTTRMIKYLEVVPYLKMNKRLMSIFMTMIDVIKHRGLDLELEDNYEGGLLLHNYTPGDDHECDNPEDCECDNYEDDEFIHIKLRINGAKIECINNTLD